MRKDQSPSQNVKRIAAEKAMSVVRSRKKGVVVAADTVVVLGKTILGKPKNKRDASRMLQLLSGKRHRVYTGFALVDAASGARYTEAVRTDVHFRKLGRQEINAYVASGIPMDKAGAYGIQDDNGAVFIEKVNGCFYNVAGLPLARFTAALEKFLKNRRPRKRSQR